MGNEELKARYAELVHEWEGAYRNPLERMSFSDFIARKVIQLEADRDNWRKQALNENARADALETRVTELEASDTSNNINLDGGTVSPSGQPEKE